VKQRDQAFVVPMGRNRRAKAPSLISPRPDRMTVLPPSGTVARATLFDWNEKKPSVGEPSAELMP